MADILNSIGAPSIGERSDEPLESHQTQESNSEYRLPDMPTVELSWNTPVARKREEELKKSYVDPIVLSRVQDIYIGMTAHVVEWLQKECRNIESAHTDSPGNTADLGGADVVTLCSRILGSNIQIPYGIKRHWEYSIGYRRDHLRYLRARLEAWDVRGSEDIERHQKFLDALHSAYNELIPEEERKI